MHMGKYPQAPDRAKRGTQMHLPYFKTVFRAKHFQTEGFKTSSTQCHFLKFSIIKSQTIKIL